MSYKPKTDAHADERAAIVKWLRSVAATHHQLAKDGQTPLVAKHHKESCEYAARAIEWGEHWGYDTNPIR